MKILDRYLVREIVPPFLLALTGLTFVLMLPPIMQSLAQLGDCGVEASFEINEGVRWPEPLPQPFPTDQFTRLLQQDFKDTQRLLLNAHPATAPSQLGGGEVNLTRS